MCLHHGDTPIPTLTRTHELRADSSSHSPQSPPAFTARRLTRTTFHVTEVDDVYDEHPFIYAKLVPAASTLLLLDTGCGGASRNPEAAFNRLRDYLERCPVTDNDGLPLNEGGKMEYVVVLSHCHYDHILGVEQFAEDSLILASGHDPAFLAPETLPQHSLCADLGIHAPSYRPVLLSHQAQITSRDRKTLGMTLLHTPGHTPDEVALWDEEEGMLYVGDTLYEWAPIIFPSEGSIVKWLGTIDSLTALVTGCGPKGESVKINCGHTTALRPALEVLRSTKAFMVAVIEGREEVSKRMMKRGEEFVEYIQEGRRYSLVCPERLVLEARRARR